MALPNSNISTTLVGQTLGTSSRDVGTLCTHPNINKWSKWKPVRVNKNGAGIILQDLINANYGLSLPTFSNLNALKVAYQAGNANWEYLKPNNQSGYRLGDFRNYEHDARQTVGNFAVSPTVANEGPTVSTTLRGMLLVNPDGIANIIGYGELNTQYKYLGIALFQGDTFIRSEINQNMGATEVNMNVALSPKVPIGDYKAVLFLSRTPTLSTVASFDSYPNDLLDVTVTISNVITILQPTWANISGTTGTIRLEILIENNTDTIITFNSASASARFYQNDYEAPLQPGEKQSPINNFVHNPDNPQPLIYTFTGMSILTDWRLWFNCSGLYERRQWTNILMPPPEQ